MKCEFCLDQVEPQRVEIGYTLCFDCATKFVTKKREMRNTLGRMSNLKNPTITKNKPES